ncbi:hypothetical protein SD51_13645 [Alicyclobacillus tengchongensis]|nr:hypothetical protein SD51_13645 [Alicyclobacillus tengchongensis]
MTTNTKPAVVYTRGMANHSNENQQQLIEQQVCGSEYHVTATFSDTSSGTSEISRRPGLQKLFEALQAKPNIHDVIVYDESRLSRRASDAGRVIPGLADMNVKVHYAANDLGSTEASATLAQFILMAERKAHGERIRRAINHKRIKQQI